MKFSLAMKTSLQNFTLRFHVSEKEQSQTFFLFICLWTGLKMDGISARCSIYLPRAKRDLHIEISSCWNSIKDDEASENISQSRRDLALISPTPPLSRLERIHSREEREKYVKNCCLYFHFSKKPFTLSLTLVVELKRTQNSQAKNTHSSTIWKHFDWVSE